MQAIRFTQRRLRSLSAVMAAAALIVLAAILLQQSLVDFRFPSGYSLAGMIVFLAAFNLRKKLPGLPLGSSSAWLQMHIYIALLSIFMLGVHISWRWPNGALETVLFAVYAGTCASGVMGLYLTRTLPRKLNATKEQPFFESIPSLLAALKQEARDLVVAAAAVRGGETLANFYDDDGAKFLELPRGLGYYVYPTAEYRRQLLRKLADLSRYLSPEGREYQSRLAACIQRKDDLDFHHATQGMLKMWLFVHIPLTYTLLLLTGAHGVLVHVYRGS